MSAHHLLAVVVVAVAAGLIIAGSLWSIVRQGGCQTGGSPLASAPCVDGRQP